MNKAAYSDVRLQPMILQDDLSRLCCSADSARAAVRRMENIMKLKQLTINVSKSSKILLNVKLNILHLVLIKEKQSEKYLGDMIDGGGGLTASIESTISEDICSNP